MLSWRDRGVLITGASGLLGGWMTRRLVREGARVVCLVRDWVPECELIASGTAARVTVVRGDLGDQSLLERILNEHEIRTVFHLAAQTIVGVANRNPVSTFETNIAGSWRLLEACRRCPLTEQIVFASSDKAYGSQPVLPYSEEAPLQGLHPYDASKSCADLLAQTYANTYGLPVAITRCGNLYGGGDLNWNRIVPGSIRSILRGEPPVIRSDGRFVRDYFFVEDAVSAYLLLAEGLAAGRARPGEAFNFSNETPVSVLDLVGRILSLMDSPLEPLVLDQASHEIREQFLSAAKARRVLSWKPSFTLDQGLAATIAWYRRLLEGESVRQLAAKLNDPDPVRN